MSEFSNEDREMLVRTATIVERIEKNHSKTLDDHEQRIRKSESFRYKLLGWAMGAGVMTAGAVEAVKTKLGL